MNLVPDRLFCLKDVRILLVRASADVVRHLESGGHDVDRRVPGALRANHGRPEAAPASIPPFHSVLRFKQIRCYLPMAKVEAASS